MSMLTTSITDQPIVRREDDKLRSKRYAETLSLFIQQSDTPLTVGLQGEWGTGKTSMMHMLREILEEENVATSWVNTWEYSMFRDAKETTPAVLRGMLEKLKESCVEKGTWSNTDEANQKVRQIGRFIGNLANQVVKKQVGIDVLDAAGDQVDAELATEISFIRNQINEVIRDLIRDSDYSRVVFFVDDLDRIPPADAVEVLEALKNMFDVPNCIYVLAIDYEVVVKGLEGKFGKKTEENEREFRSFFDKIIQVPFSMPTGTYDISQLLEDKLGKMGITIPESQTEAYTNVVKNTVGFNPRSLKRFMNSFSLLRRLRDISDEDESKSTNYDDLVLFGLLGLQISYNKIFRLLTQESRFWDWDTGTASKFKVDLEYVEEEVSKFGEEYKEKVDERWEQIIFGFCNAAKAGGRPDPYLSARWENIVDLLNLLGLTVFGKDYSAANDQELDLFETAWNNGLSFAAITNVDDDPVAKAGSEKKKKSKVKYETVEDKIPDLLSQGARPENLQIWQNLALFITEQSDSTWTHSLAGSYITAKNKYGTVFFKLYNPTGKKLGISATIHHKKNYGTVRVRPESALLSKDISKTEFKIRIEEEADLAEVKDIFLWASKNS